MYLVDLFIFVGLDMHAWAFDKINSTCLTTHMKC